ncbi:MAG: hypothetical protein NTY48_02365 [Candidatus Diapherotrites archaeon]|nr:hypothetical protein [Candidatus Diapherotrites archaeon]
MNETKLKATVLAEFNQWHRNNLLPKAVESLAAQFGKEGATDALIKQWLAEARPNKKGKTLPIRGGAHNVQEIKTKDIVRKACMKAHKESKNVSMEELIREIKMKTGRTLKKITIKSIIRHINRQNPDQRVGWTMDGVLMLDRKEKERMRRTAREILRANKNPGLIKAKRRAWSNISLGLLGRLKKRP